jgi:ribonuclease Z
VRVVSARELVVLGTASQAPTRTRNHNGYLLRWDDEGVLFDPGEGTQRQLVLAGVPVSAVTRICITHFHGDHCLGLPGVLQRRSLDRVAHPVDVYFPSSGADYFERLRYGTAHHEVSPVRPRPLRVPDASAEVHAADAPGFRLVARPLDHRVETLGWRLEEPPGRRMLADRLAAHGIVGPDVGRLQREGLLRRGERVVHLEEVSQPRPGQVFAFVMDTRECDDAVALAQGADLLVCEATFVERDAHLAEQYAHLTARQAAQIARRAGARRLVLTHLSQRYDDPAEHLAEAAAVFPDVVVAADLDRVAVPGRRG